jgi:hypothetical protein
MIKGRGQERTRATKIRTDLDDDLGSKSSSQQKQFLFLEVGQVRGNLVCLAKTVSPEEKVVASRRA